MDHFYQNIQGWFDWEPVYQAAVKTAPADKPSVFVEVGAWKGKSSAYLATEIINSGKPIELHIVDGFDGRGHTNPDGSPEYQHYQADIAADLFKTFTANMAPVGDKYIAHGGDAAEIAAQFEDASVDFVFFDASVEYNEFKAQLIAWMPKIKPGGFIAGHDYFNNNVTQVPQVVRELLPNHKTDSSSWYSRIGDADLTPFQNHLVKQFSQAVGPAQSDAYYRGKYAAVHSPLQPTVPPTGVVADNQNYLRGKYAAF